MTKRHREESHLSENDVYSKLLPEAITLQGVKTLFTFCNEEIEPVTLLEQPWQRRLSQTQEVGRKLQDP